jgi:hypothetical protein
VTTTAVPAAITPRRRAARCLCFLFLCHACHPFT